MEPTLRFSLLKERIYSNDIAAKNLLKDISDCDKDLRKMNLLNEEFSDRINNIRQDLLECKRLAKAIDDSQLKKELNCMQNQFELLSNLARKTMKTSQDTINRNARSKLFEYTNQLRNRIDSSLNQLTSNTGRNNRNQEKTANQATELTEDLYSVSRTLAYEVEKSKGNLDTLITSSATATETSEELKTMANYIGNSKTLLSKYGRREMTDKILTMLAFGFFFGCVIYVVVKRIYLR